ncbi:lysylphosphatidylglycerol synthase domain-containing protein [Pseudorhodoplanes sp.]|uniref:lysylphosphatidylglycerol synthase domain-containing protein n=1 Tax=Pseudorhodoplanes sp. TaxID=1934341 RepID=UPI002CDDD5A7|nr:lysylphosphatidylglycerol synthase domain-containing protein [Pseudorhodoplanes sp.]HWV42918.1 lysylphosphatidylglycerol synthase domain-containing protein [Pseudorhodoplanes sp.]
MLEMLRSVARFVSEKIGWHRIGFALSILIIAVAAVVLYRVLHNIDIQEVFKALRATDPRDFWLAALFVAFGYFTLTFYDLFALRTIGRQDVSYPTAALAGFTSYSVGHNVGASAFTGGAVRYRIYSAHGVSAIEVAKICFVAGLTFWLGNATVLGLGIFYAPEAASAINHLPEWFNRTLAGITIVILAAYVIWVWIRPRAIGRSGWQVTLPGGPLTFLQIVIGIVDLGCCAAAMYMLLPDQPHINFVMLAVVFVSATLLGFASHSPGGLGVFDAAMLLALWQFNREELLASLLLFRLLYYIIPFALALAILGGREIVKGMFTSRVPQLGEIATDVFINPPAGERATGHERKAHKPSNVDGSKQ